MTPRDRLLKQFRELVGVRLERINRAIVELESGGNVETGRKALRELHGLKGEARMMGFDSINVLVHEMEELVRSIEPPQYALSHDSADALLKSADAVTILSGAGRPPTTRPRWRSWWPGCASAPGWSRPSWAPPCPTRWCCPLCRSRRRRRFSAPCRRPPPAADGCQSRHRLDARRTPARLGRAAQRLRPRPAPGARSRGALRCAQARRSVLTRQRCRPPAAAPSPPVPSSHAAPRGHARGGSERRRHQAASAQSRPEPRADSSVRIEVASLDLLTSAATNLSQVARRRELANGRRLALARELAQLAREAEDLGPAGARARGAAEQGQGDGRGAAPRGEAARQRGAEGPGPGGGRGAAHPHAAALRPLRALPAGGARSWRASWARKWSWWWTARTPAPTARWWRRCASRCCT